MTFSQQKRMSYYLLLAPGLLLFASIIIFPVFYSFSLSFTSFGGYGKQAFIGLENYAKINGELVKQPNHSFFAAFAPIENPRIAIMCVVENSGRYGGTYAAPIVSLMIEKYITDSISAPRKALVERMASTNLIPPLMMKEIIRMDSLKRSKEADRELKVELNNIRTATIKANLFINFILILP